MANTIKNLMANVKREKLLSISNIFVMTLTFVLLGFFISIIVGTQTTLKRLEQQAQITAFFKDDFPEKNIMELKARLETDERILSVAYVSKDQAFKIFTDINKDEPVLLESISADILPASLEIRAKKLSDLGNISSELSSLDGVEEVKYFRDVIDKFKTFSGVITIIGVALLIIFFLTSYAVIIVTLRTTIHSKGTELEIMKLVGASDTYVKTPLLYQGMFFGIVSAFVASIILVLYLQVFLAFMAGGFLGMDNNALTIFPGVFVRPILFQLFLVIILLISGVSLGYLGSLTAVKKYLKY